ncbi:hypothetical protein V6N13_039764 [Hibiscus sabdariffa]|uniref:Uncharacterized protein n=1 Tax=Hibiscus sabdariffa TaxID=183260 RepID=A0ABR2SUU0_9ROSI
MGGSMMLLNQAAPATDKLSALASTDVAATAVDPLLVLGPSIVNTSTPTAAASSKGKASTPKAILNLETYMGKSFLPTSSVMLDFDYWLSKKSTPNTAYNIIGSLDSNPRGIKKHSTIQDAIKNKRPQPSPHSSSDKVGMSSEKNSPVVVDVQTRRGK